MSVEIKRAKSAIKGYLLYNKTFDEAKKEAVAAAEIKLSTLKMMTEQQFREG